MKKICISVVLACLLFTLGCSCGESYSRAGFEFGTIDKVAVVDVIGNVGGDAARNQIGDFFAMELLKKGYAPIERAQVQSLLKEQEFQASELTPEGNAARAGRIINVPTVVVVNIPEFSENINMTAKMVDVEDGSILWMASGSGTTGSTLSTIAGAAAGVLGGVAVSGEDDKVVGGVAGGVLGGVAGRALSPQKADKVKEITRKMCKTMPYRFKPEK